MSRPQCVDLTATHKRIIKVINRFADKGISPSVGELASELRLAGPSSLNRTIRIMERNGFINVHGGGNHGKRRSVTVSSRAKALLGAGAIPVLGKIPAGPFSEALQEYGTIVEASSLLCFQPGDFFLVVHGNSLNGDGILSGDKVLIRPGVDSRDGEIAAVLVGSQYDTSLKHVHFNRSRGTVRLRASNPEYADIVVPAAELQIVGVYRGLVRNKP